MEKVYCRVLLLLTFYYFHINYGLDKVWPTINVTWTVLNHCSVIDEVIFMFIFNGMSAPGMCCLLLINNDLLGLDIVTNFKLI